MSYKFRNFFKKSAILTVLSIGYSLWFWGNDGLPFLRLLANILSVAGMAFFVWGLINLVHNTHALAAFSYSFRYVVNMVRDLKNRDAATNEPIIEYHEYVSSYEKRGNVLWCFVIGAALTALSLVLWYLS